MIFMDILIKSNVKKNKMNPFEINWKTSNQL